MSYLKVIKYHQLHQEFLSVSSSLLLTLEEVSLQTHLRSWMTHEYIVVL